MGDDRAAPSNTDLVEVCRQLEARCARQERRIDELEGALEGIHEQLGLTHVVVAADAGDGMLWGWSAVPNAFLRDVREMNQRGHVLRISRRLTEARAIEMAAELESAHPSTGYGYAA